MYVTFEMASFNINYVNYELLNVHKFRMLVYIKTLRPFAFAQTSLKKF